MTKQWIQFAGLIALSLLAAGLLGIIAYAIYLMGQHITTDGKVPVLDAGLFTSSLLSFQQTVGGIRSIWESQERQSLSESLSNSTPTVAPVSDTPQPVVVTNASDDPVPTTTEATV